MTTTPNNPPGSVFLVGAGPGDPGLLTLRAVECLSLADFVLYDYLVNPAILKHARPTAELFGLGHHSLGRTLTPEQIVERMVEEAQQGRVVVRLKGGDPSVFGRGADEVGALRDAGISYEIVPGITAGLAVAAYTEIPITHHDDASAIAMIVGQERHCKVASALDYGALAGFPGTLVFYMGVRTADHWSHGLIEKGKPADTPVAIVRRCTCAEQETIRCSLENVVATIAERKIRPPSIFVIGKVVDRAPDLSWFEARPLSSTRVLVGGSPATSERLRARLSGLGAHVFLEPAIRITDPPDWAPVDTALEQLDQYDWLVFSSGNGVDYFFRRMIERGDDARRLGQVKLATVGSATAERLKQYNLKADVVPQQFNAESLAQALVDEAAGQRFLLTGTNRGRPVLSDTLNQAGAHVDEIVVYGTVDVDEPNPEVAMALSCGEIHWITVTSSGTARSLVRLYGDALKSARFASISPLTSAALRDLGYEPAAEASPHTSVALVEAILRDGE